MNDEELKLQIGNNIASYRKQRHLTQAKLAEYQAIYNFVVAKAQLEQTLGHEFVD